MFTRGFEYLFFAQQATAPHQADVFVDYIKSLPADQRPKTAAYPTQDDPFTRPVIESMQKQLEALGVKTVYSEVYPADTTNFQTIASTLADKKPDLIAQGAVFEDGVGLVRSLKQLDYSPKMLFQTSAPSNAGQYSDGVGEANTEGVFYTVSWNEEATTPKNAEFVAGLRRRVRRRDPGRGRGGRVRRGRGAAGGGRGDRLLRPGQDRATGCTPTRCRRSSARCPGTRRASRRATSCWPSGSPARSRSSARPTSRPPTRSSTRSRRGVTPDPVAPTSDPPPDHARPDPASTRPTGSWSA